MKRSTPSKSVSGASQSKSSEKQVVSTPVQEVVVSETQPKPSARKTKKPAKEVQSTVDVIPSPSVGPPPTPSVSLEKVSEPVPPSLGEHLDAELASVPADDLEVKCASYVNALRDVVNRVSELKTEYKAIERLWLKRLKNVSKYGKKKKSTGARAPSGFVKPTLISDELASFLGKTPGTEMARTEVTREINVYIRQNGLQDSSNGRKINADPALSALLRLSPSDELTYFNLQKYMSSHFPKTVVVA